MCFVCFWLLKYSLYNFLSNKDIIDTWLLSKGKKKTGFVYSESQNCTQVTARTNVNMYINDKT